VRSSTEQGGRDAGRGPVGPVLRLLADVPLPGGASRFDYQSLDEGTGRLYVSHMGAGRLVVFDVRAQKVLADLDGFPRVTGVLAVPELGRVYASAAGAHEVIVVDAGTLRILARIGGARFPDGLAYAPDERKVFISDEMGRTDLVVDGRTEESLGTVALGGEAGNTRYDPGSHCVLVAVQTRDQLVAIDPGSQRIVARYDLVGCSHPHGLYVDEPRRLAFVACQGNARLLTLDLRTMRPLGSHPVGGDPDVLAFDPGWRRLYVAAESGVLSVFDERGDELAAVGEIRAPHAHSVAVDPSTHRVYLPLEDVDGRPVLRILEGIAPGEAEGE
jgi:DNA-binding beta-propeller fold protein YncE